MKYFFLVVLAFSLNYALSFGQGQQNRIGESGNIGIGTRNPTSNLHIFVDQPIMPIGAFSLDIRTFGNTSNAQKSYYFRVQDLSTSTTPLYIRGDGNIGVGTNGPSSLLHLKRNRADLRIENSASNDWAFLTIKGSGQNYWDIAQYGDSAKLEFRPRGGDANRIVFTQNGNVGIGTVDLASKLHLKVAASSAPIGAITVDVQSFGTSANAKSSYYFRVRDIGAGPSTPFYIQGDGNVGIGTPTPEAKLHIVAPAGAPANLRLLGSELTDTNDGTLHLRSGGSFVTFDGGDNIGIGVLKPEAKLHIATPSGEPANIRLLGSELTDTNDGILRIRSGGSLVAFDGNDKLGIGTTQPSGKLDVVGNTFIRRGIGLEDKIILSAGDQNVGIELRSETSKGTPYIDFANDGVTDFDARIILVGDRLLSIESNITVAGETKTKILDITGGSDLSEGFNVNEPSDFESKGLHQAFQPGMIVCIDKEKPGELIMSNKAYDKAVAGIISGANGVQSGIMMKQDGSAADGNVPVALMGRVYCWADASYGSIEPGDLLTTSDSYGHAMKATDYAKAQGAIIGKAMSSLKEGKGLVLVLVTLQ